MNHFLAHTHTHLTMNTLTKSAKRRRRQCWQTALQQNLTASYFLYLGAMPYVDELQRHMPQFLDCSLCWLSKDGMARFDAQDPTVTIRRPLKLQTVVTEIQSFLTIFEDPQGWFRRAYIDIVPDRPGTRRICPVDYFLQEGKWRYVVHGSGVNLLGYPTIQFESIAQTLEAEERQRPTCEQYPLQAHSS
jgi:hypothetical protein